MTKKVNNEIQSHN